MGVLLYWCGSAGVGWYPSAGWGTSAQHQPCVKLCMLVARVEGTIFFLRIYVYETHLTYFSVVSAISISGNSAVKRVKKFYKRITYIIFFLIL